LRICAARKFRHRVRERRECGGIEIRDCAGERGVIFGATREEKRVHVVHVGEECGGFARGFGCCERFAVGAGVAPGGAQFGVRVECGAEVRGFGGGRSAGWARGVTRSINR
jgi:hypothetical protein